jgi:hypothetical protein
MMPPNEPHPTDHLTPAHFPKGESKTDAHVSVGFLVLLSRRVIARAGKR